MKRFYRILPIVSVVFICLLLAACAPLSTDSGISGSIVIQSAAAGNAAPASKPFTDAIIIVRDAAGGKEIARTHAGSQGSFKIYLPAGSYSVEPQNDAGTVLPRADAQIVVVMQGAFTDITVTFK
jgi:hypothetical protein